MKKLAIVSCLVCMLVMLCSLCAAEGSIPHSYLSAEEAADVLRNLDGYYENISLRCLQYFMQDKNPTPEAYIEYSAGQALDFTAEETAAIDAAVASIEQKLTAAGMKLPDNVAVSFAKTTMMEALGAAGYTHGTTVFLGGDALAWYLTAGEESAQELEVLVAHELFHCLTRNNPEFRKDMYALIHFTVEDEEFVIPEEVRAQMISNPDVGRHDSHALFTINGEQKDCYFVFLTQDAFEQPGDTFFSGMYTGLVDIADGTLYHQAEASDFYDVVGRNTAYCEDPEECMATNFSYAVVFGMELPNGGTYPSPEIIEGIIACMQK
ncbi:MAG: hypothetical protein Q4C54_05425 [Clostridia bacterium]|nr:hypothetical protein [Clostridia bacterium]